MAPIKLEDHIREQFEEREITPSAGAWDKLETKLDVAQGKKRPLFIWYAIAASIIGILFISSQFFSGKDTKDQQLVETKTEVVPKEKSSTSEILKTETQLAKEDIAPDIINTTPLKNEVAKDKKKDVKISPKPILKTKNSIIKKDDKSRLAVQEKEKSLNNNVSEVINKDVYVNNKVDEVVAAVEKIKLKQNTVTAAEIDALLLDAQRELATERLLNETKIDATALLQDVEFELEKSFRDKVFDALGDSFSTIRTAVVERNN